MKFKAKSGKVIHKKVSEDYIIEVRELNDMRWLNFGDDAVQSAMSLKDPSAIVLPYLAPLITGVELLHQRLERILILGLGGGSIYRYFHELLPRADISVVEINQDVIDVAKAFFSLPKSNHQRHIIHGDAEAFLQTNELPYDLIISDIYSTYCLPEILKKQSYYELCKHQLTKDGLLVVNLVVEDSKELNDTVGLIKTAFNKSTLSVPLRHYHNTIVFAKKSTDFYQRLEKLQQQGELTDVQYDFAIGYFAHNLQPRAEKRASIFEKLFK